MGFLKHIPTLFIVAAMLIALSACGAAPGSDNNDETVPASAGAADTGGGGTVTLLTWTNPSAVAYLEGMAGRLYSATGITLEISAIESGLHVASRQTRLIANDIDIVTFENGFLQPLDYWNEEMMDEPFWQTFIDAGLLLDLSDQPFLQPFDMDLLLDAYGYEDRLYALMAGSIPLNGLFYNRTKLTELGLIDMVPPQTWDDFVLLCEAIIAAGYNPITNGAGDTWPLNMFVNNILTNIYLDDASEVSRALFLGERSFTDPDWLENYRKFEQFVSFMEPGVAGIPYGDVYGRFANESALMLADGFWAAGDVLAANPDFEFAYFPLPGRLPRPDGLPHQMGVKFDFAMGINANSPNIDNALRVLAFFSDPSEYRNFVEEVGFFPTQPDVEFDNPFLRDVEVYMQQPRMIFPTYTPRGVGEYGGNSGANLFLLRSLGGPFTYYELAAAAQEDWDTARAAAAALRD